MLLYDPPAPPTTTPADEQPTAAPPSTWRTFHATPAGVILVVAVVFLIGFVGEWILAKRRPGGSSVSGFLAGVVAGGLFLYLLLYAFRKKKGISRLFRGKPIKHYLAWHVWLGVLTLPLVLLHANGPLCHLLDVFGVLPSWAGPTRPGGFVALLFLFVYLGVFVSGVYGLWLQQSLPGRLLRDVPDETIRSQIPALIDELRLEAALLVRAVCGPPAASLKRDDVLTEATREAIGRARHKKGAGLLRPITGVHAVGPNAAAESRVLWEFYFDRFEPYFQQPSAASRLELPAQAKADFDDLRGRLRPELHPLVEALQEAVERRRQFDEQTRWHDRLHAWIPVHLVLTAALVVLLVAHGVSSFIYW